MTLFLKQNIFKILEFQGKLVTRLKQIQQLANQKSEMKRMN